MDRSLTIVIPAFNEENNLNQALDDALRAITGTIDDYEIIIIDDASQDNTRAVALGRAGKNARIQVIHNEHNMGFGYSFWRGVMLARKEHVTVYPADNEMSWQTLRDMSQNIGKAEVITSYMTNQEARDWLRRGLSQLFVAIMNTAFGMRLKYFNGPFIIRRQLLQSLKIRSHGLTVLAECKVRLIKNGHSYLETPFAHIPRNSGRSTALSFKSIKAVTSAMSGLFWDIYFGKKEGNVLSYGNN